MDEYVVGRSGISLSFQVVCDGAWLAYILLCESKKEGVMGVFSRFSDIVSANINAMLDRAEDPEKMIRLMIREMEETLVEIKADCAGLMARRKKLGRELDDVRERSDLWRRRAELAVEKGRDDLAREALAEKLRWQERAQILSEEAEHFDRLIAQSQEDISRVEEKLASAVEKQRVLVQRHRRATIRIRAHEDIRRADGGEAMLRFEQMVQRIERMEAEADLVAPPRRPTLEEEFTQLEGVDDVSRELEALKQQAGKRDEPTA